MKTSFILYFLGSLAVIYLIICLLMYHFQERLMFFPIELADDYPFTEFSEFEELYLQTQDGARLHALHFQLNDPKGVVLYFHGNAGALDSWGINAKDFRSRGYEVLMPDYRTYGKSKGRMSQRALQEDAYLMYQQLTKSYPPEKIILYGRSLGSGIACKLATRVDARLLVLETPYSSIAAMARLQMPFAPTGYLLKYRFPTIRNIRKVKCPVHIFHGTEDELIPYKMAQKLTSKYGDDSILTTIPGGMHGDLPNFDLYQQKLDELL